MFSLNRSYYGLYVPKGLWREMENFSTNAFALEFSSTNYHESDYINSLRVSIKNPDIDIDKIAKDNLSRLATIIK